MHSIQLKRRSLLLLMGLCLFSLVAVAFEIKQSQPSGLKISPQETALTSSLITDEHSAILSGEESSATSQEKIPVYLVGAIQRPGIYQVLNGCYLYEVVELAGGLTQDAAHDAINLAMKITGNCHIRIPTLKELSENPSQMVVLVDPDESDSSFVNINTASAEELDQLPGIGPATARSIIEFRQRNGPFNSLEDLMKVSGIKQSRLDAIRDLITVS